MHFQFLKQRNQMDFGPTCFYIINKPSIRQHGKIDKCFKWYFALTTIAILFTGCRTHYSISKYAQYNRTENLYYNTFVNDSLRLSIDFLGIHLLDSSPVKEDFASKTNRNFIKKSIGKNRLNFLFKYTSSLSFKNDCYVYILNKQYKFDTANFTVQESIIGDTIYFSKKIQVKNNQEMLLCGAKVGTTTLFLLYKQELHAKLKFPIKFKAIEELETIRTEDNFQAFIQGRKSISEIIAKAYDYGNSYITDKNTLLNISLDSISKYDLEKPYYQSLISTLSFFDDLSGMKKYNDQYHQYLSKSNTFIKPDLKKINPKNDAIQEVLSFSTKQKMLMFNESHYDFRNRLFVYLLLDSLYQNGYRNLCLEDRRSAAGVFNNKFPSKNDGFYIKEPFMGSIVRKAFRLGFNVYGYDQNTGSFDEREERQAQNLFDLYKKDSLNKWIVLGGYSHMNKSYFNGDYKSTYQNFVDLSGFRPFSINQSYFSDILNQEHNIQPDRIGFFFINGDTTNKMLKQADLYILNNILQNPFEDPFYPPGKSLIKFEVNFKKQLPANCILLIYVKDEYAALGKDAIPIYIGSFTSIKNKGIFLPNDVYKGFAMSSKDEMIDTIELRQN